MADAIEAVRGRCEEIGRDSAKLMLATGTNPAWPYPGLKATGKQRMMKQEDLPAIMDYDFSAILPRADELRRWVDLGLDRVICGVPGLVDTDEGLARADRGLPGRRGGGRAGRLEHLRVCGPVARLRCWPAGTSPLISAQPITLISGGPLAQPRGSGRLI